MPIFLLRITSKICEKRYKYNRTSLRFVTFHNFSPNSDLFNRLELLTFPIISTPQAFGLDFFKAFFILTPIFLFTLKVSIQGSGWKTGKHTHKNFLTAGINCKIFLYFVEEIWRWIRKWMAFSDHMNQYPKIHHFHQISDCFYGLEFRRPLFKAVI